MATVAICKNSNGVVVSWENHSKQVKVKKVPSDVSTIIKQTNTPELAMLTINRFLSKGE